MIPDLIRLTVQRIMRDKILLGLVIIGILAIFVGGFSTSEEPKSTPPDKSSNTTASTAGQDSQAGYSASTPLQPSLATDFVNWWTAQAMNYNPASAQQTHQVAEHFMTPEAKQTFQQLFWYPNLSEAVTKGNIVGNFQPSAIQAEAINPDGSVVVGITGMLTLQANGQPTAQPIIADLLVRKGPEHFTIAGIYKRLPSISSATVY